MAAALIAAAAARAFGEDDRRLLRPPPPPSDGSPAAAAAAAPRAPWLLTKENLSTSAPAMPPRVARSSSEYQKGFPLRLAPLLPDWLLAAEAAPPATYPAG